MSEAKLILIVRNYRDSNLKTQHSNLKTEKVYFVLSGKLTVVTPDKKEITLEPMDSLYIPAGEERYLINNEKVPASMLVIISYN